MSSRQKLLQAASENKQVIVITETDGDANIHWDTKSLEETKNLLYYAYEYIKGEIFNRRHGIKNNSSKLNDYSRFRTEGVIPPDYIECDRRRQEAHTNVD